MNSRIYLQPNAVPDKEMIRTANRLFQYFGKEVTFLKDLDLEDQADITMNRLRWAISRGDFSKALKKSSNIILDLSELPTKDELTEIKENQAFFEKNPEMANLVIIQKSGEVLEFAKADQSKARAKK